MMIHFTSDSHFGHENVLKYCNRPFKDTTEMDESLIDNWNKCVKKDDIVYHLGDFSMSGKESYLVSIVERLNGFKYLIKGNHDKGLLKSSASAHFHWVKDVYCLKHDNHQIFLSHFAHRVWDQSHRGAFHLFGHSHGTLPPQGKSVDIGVDSPYITGKPEYRPFSYDEIKSFMATRESEFVDHHRVSSGSTAK